MLLGYQITVIAIISLAVLIYKVHKHKMKSAKYIETRKVNFCADCGKKFNKHVEISINEVIVCKECNGKRYDLLKIKYYNSDI